LITNINTSTIAKSLSGKINTARKGARASTGYLKRMNDGDYKVPAGKNIKDANALGADVKTKLDALTKLDDGRDGTKWEDLSDDKKSLLSDAVSQVGLVMDAVTALDNYTGRPRPANSNPSNKGRPHDSDSGSDSDSDSGSEEDLEEQTTRDQNAKNAADLDEKKKRELVASAKSAEASYEKAINLAKKNDTAAPKAVEVAIKHNKQFLDELNIFPINGYTPSNVKSLKAEATKRVNELGQTKTKLDETAKVGAKAKAGVDADDDDPYPIY
jgi:hypothetical protein